MPAQKQAAAYLSKWKHSEDADVIRWDIEIVGVTRFRQDMGAFDY